MTENSSTICMPLDMMPLGIGLLPIWIGLPYTSQHLHLQEGINFWGKIQLCLLVLVLILNNLKCKKQFIACNLTDRDHDLWFNPPLNTHLICLQFELQDNVCYLLEWVKNITVHYQPCPQNPYIFLEWKDSQHRRSKWERK